MKLSTIVIDYRKRMQISQREFARRCGLSNSYISFIENEYNPRTGKPIVPTLEQYHKIASCMGMTVHQLFEQLDEDSPVDMREPVSNDAPLHYDPDIRIVSGMMENMSPEQKHQIVAIVRAVVNTSSEKKEGCDDC